MAKAIPILAGLSAALLLRSQTSVAPSHPSPTYSKDIAPILRQNCILCHRPGESGPFPLLTYEDAKKRARLIADVTTRRFMPPWLPQPGYGDFEDARRL